MTINKRNLKVLGNALTLACLCFVVISMMREGTAFLELFESGEVRRISFISIGVFSLLIFLNVYIWKSLLVSISKKKICYNVAMDIYVKANIYKYLPGNVMHLVGRNMISSLYDMKDRDVMIATVLELLSAIIACVLVVCFFYYQNLEELFRIRLSLPLESSYLFFIVVMLVALIGGFVLRKNIRKIIMSLDKKLVRAISVQFLKTLLLHIAVLFISGMCYAFLLKAMLLDGQVSAGYSGLIAAYITAWFFGFITPGSPGGIGVREAMLIFILGSVYSRDIIVMSTLLIRLITVMADVGAYGFLVVSKGIHSFIHKRVQGKVFKKIL